MYLLFICNRDTYFLLRMLKIHVIFGVCCLLAIGTWAQNFKAAVVEFKPPSYDAPVIPEIRLTNNVDKYYELATTYKSKYDIIVFPESTLYTGILLKEPGDIFPYSTVVPESNENVIACDNNKNIYASYLKKLSCMAKDLKKFVVVNLAENEPCTGSEECPLVGYKVYNTNVVFDKEGKVLAKYRKYNLFGEVYMAKPEVSFITFEIEPGVKFGMFTCFDIIFKEPAIDLIKKHAVKAIVYPLMWFSELPFLTALQSQQQWATELDVILLAAGANREEVGSGGSGIYNGKEGAKVATITAKESKVLTLDFQDLKIKNQSKTLSESDIDAEAKQMDTFFLLKDNLKSYTSQLLDPSKRSVKTEVCNGVEPNKICCQFSVTTTLDENILKDGKNHYQYHLVAFSGVRTFSGVATGGNEVCAVVACQNEKLDTCGERFKDYSTISWPLSFTGIEVKAKFAVDEKRIQFPNSLLSNIRPLSTEESEWTKKPVASNLIERTHKLVKDQTRLMTFGIYGRDFNRDGQEITKPDDDNKEEEEEKEEEKKHNKPNDNGSGIVRLNSASMFLGCLVFIVNICNI